MKVENELRGFVKVVADVTPDAPLIDPAKTPEHRRVHPAVALAGGFAAVVLAVGTGVLLIGQDSGDTESVGSGEAPHEVYADCMADRGFIVEQDGEDGSKFIIPEGREAQGQAADEYCSLLAGTTDPQRVVPSDPVPDGSEPTIQLTVDGSSLCIDAATIVGGTSYCVQPIELDVPNVLGVSTAFIGDDDNGFTIEALEILGVVTETADELVIDFEGGTVYRAGLNTPAQGGFRPYVALFESPVTSPVRVFAVADGAIIGEVELPSIAGP